MQFGISRLYCSDISSARCKNLHVLRHFTVTIYTCCVTFHVFKTKCAILFIVHIHIDSLMQYVLYAFYEANKDDYHCVQKLLRYPVVYIEVSFIHNTMYLHYKSLLFTMKLLFWTVLYLIVYNQYNTTFISIVEVSTHINKYISTCTYKETYKY